MESRKKLKIPKKKITSGGYLWSVIMLFAILDDCHYQKSTK